MPDDRAYRIQIRFDAATESFTATVPELDLEANAESRADVVEMIESEIDARIQAAADGDPLPEPADVAEVSGELSLEISPPLQRDLLFYANRFGMSPEALAAELIAKGLGGIEGGRQSARPAREERGGERRDGGDDDRRGDRNQGRRRRKREGYRPELDDKSNFMDYLRKLEKGEGGGGRGGGGGGGGGRR